MAFGVYQDSVPTRSPRPNSRSTHDASLKASPKAISGENQLSPVRLEFHRYLPLIPTVQHTWVEPPIRLPHLHPGHG